MKCNCMYGKSIVDLVLCYETKIKHRRVIVSGFNVQLWYSVEGKFHILHMYSCTSRKALWYCTGTV